MPNNKDKEEFIKTHPRVVAREMPNNYDAEVALLGGMLIDGQTAGKFMPQLSESDFYTPSHRYVFAALYDLFSAAKPIDFVTVVGALESRGTLAFAGGVDYLTKMIEAVPSVANSDYYYGLVKKMSQLRTVIEVARKMADAAYALDPDGDALSVAESELYSLAESTRRGKPEKLEKFVQTVLEDLQKRSTETSAYRGVPTGFQKADNILGGGFQNSDLIFLAARPGQGKTSFAMNCAVNAALRRRPDTGKPFSVAVFSLEMSAVQLTKRILCSVGNYDMSRANRAVVEANEWDRLYAARDELVRTNLYIDESGDIKPAEILSKCRALKHSVGLDFVVIDYLQLMQSGKKSESVVKDIGYITRDLKLAAKELDIPILLLSQMSRSIEQRKGPDKESRLSDLRDSGAIEQDADIVLFIDRKENPGGGNEKPASSEVFLNIAKHRNGETGFVKLIWHPATTTFTSPRDEGVPEPPKYYSGRDVGFDESAPPPPDDYDYGGGDGNGGAGGLDPVDAGFMDD